MKLYQKLMVSSVSAFGVFLTIVSTSTKAAAVTSDPEFTFSYSSVTSSSNAITASGELMTDAYDPTTNAYPITGIIGTRNGITIDSLIPSGGYLNDNLLIAGSPVLGYGGFSYSAGGQDYNVFHNISEYNELSNSGAFAVNFSLTPQPIQPATVVPEPSVLGGVVSVGVIAIGVLLKRRLNMNINQT
ncbi:MAG: hypothetical protein JOZ78_16810 [Chroococcidiopsidaceae cyanobacterium CP_BM_ER_R8_30]|nr:hypothetical protein [Chroococcidiopsidaceae cyanobacterium CP_BM_ER_R8_30]